MLATSQSEPVDALVLDLERQDAVSITILDTLADLDRELAQAGITLHLVGLPDRAKHVVEKVDWYRELAAEGRVHPTVEAGMVAASAP